MKLLLTIGFICISLLSYSQCKSLRKKGSPADSVTTIYTPADEAVIAIKTFNKEEARFSLTLAAPATTSGDRKGVIIMLDNGIKFELPDEVVTVKTESYHPQWNNTNLVAKAQVSLADEQIKQLSEHRIVSYKLADFSWELRDQPGKELQLNINCLLTAQPGQIKQ